MTIKKTAKGYQLDNAKRTVNPDEINRVATMAGIAPKRPTILGVARYVKILRNLATA
jgi:hypothetical protein